LAIAAAVASETSNFSVTFNVEAFVVSRVVMKTILLGIAPEITTPNPLYNPITPSDRRMCLKIDGPVVCTASALATCILVFTTDTGYNIAETPENSPAPTKKNLVLSSLHNPSEKKNHTREHHHRTSPSEKKNHIREYHHITSLSEKPQ
jgi:hypothetical protein